MWEKPFEIEMLANENGVVINCPTVEAYMEMARVLDKHGFRFGNGVSPIDEDVDWVEHGEDFCFYAKGSRIYYGLSIVQKRHLGEVTQNVRFMA